MSVKTMLSGGQEIREKVVPSGLSMQRVPANMTKVGPNRLLNSRGAHSRAVNNQSGRISNRMGQPYPVFRTNKTNWGLSRVQG